MKINDKVRVKKGYQYGGRVGVIVRQNKYETINGGGLWYVDLEATKRAKRREACIWGEYLELVD
jgi:hypothetical protein